MSDLTLLVMAAGSSTRYGRLKQTDSLGPSGETILEYSVSDALRAGFDRVVFVIRTGIEGEFRAAVGHRVEREVDTAYVFQDRPAGAGLDAPVRDKPWGTGHAVLAAASELDGPFAVVNADDYYGHRAFTVLAEHLRSGPDAAALVGFPLRNTLSRHGAVSRGICRFDADRSLQAVDETFHITAEGTGAKYVDPDGVTRGLTGDEIVSMNMWGLRSTALADFRDRWEEFLSQHGTSPTAEFYLPDAVTDSIALGRMRVRVLETPETWFGVTHIEDRPLVVAGLRDLVAAGVHPERLWAAEGP